MTSPKGRRRVRDSSAKEGNPSHRHPLPRPPEGDPSEPPSRRATEVACHLATLAPRSKLRFPNDRVGGTTEPPRGSKAGTFAPRPHSEPRASTKEPRRTSTRQSPLESSVRQRLGGLAWRSPKDTRCTLEDASVTRARDSRRPFDRERQRRDTRLDRRRSDRRSEVGRVDHSHPLPMLESVCATRGKDVRERSAPACGLQAILPWGLVLLDAFRSRQRPTPGLPHPAVLRLQAFSTS